MGGGLIADGAILEPFGVKAPMIEPRDKPQAIMLHV